MVDYETIGRRLREARTAPDNKRTQAECGKVIGASEVAYGYYEAGKRRISIPDLVRIARYLNRPVSYFIEGWKPSPEDLALAQVSYRRYLQALHPNDPELVEQLVRVREALMEARLSRQALAASEKERREKEAS